jgi:hypothetical protein
MDKDKVSDILDGAKGAVGAVGPAIATATEAVGQSRKIYGSKLLFRGVLWVLLYVLSLWLLTDRTMLAIESRAARVAIALMPTPFFVWWLWTWMKGVLHMDELQRRIEFEALAFAFPAALVLLAALGLLDTAVTLNTKDFSLRHAWLIMPMLYYTGLWRAQQRYS